MSPLSTETQPQTAAVPCDLPVERPYWQSCRERAMRIQRCDDCANYRFYPGHVCDRCGSSSMTWTLVSGRAEVHTFTIVHRPAAGITQVPYVWALIELEEGAIMASNVVDCAVEDVHIGMPVTVVYHDAGPDWTIPRFRPAGEVA